MAFLGIGKTAKEKSAGIGKGFTPVERVKELGSKGFSEADMIDVLRKEGYSADEIDKALTESLRAGITPTTQKPSQQPSQPSPVPSLPPLPALEQPQQQVQMQMPIIPETSLPENYYYNQPYQTEEYVEYLVKERMGEVNEKISEFSVRYEELQKRMEEMTDQLTSIAKARTSGEQLIISKIDSFKDVLSDVDVRMNGLEKAFKDTLPALIESVRALSDLVQRMKKEG